MGRPALAILLVALSPTGCVMSPYNGDVVENTVDPVELSGYTIAPDQFMRLMASPNAQGPFTSWPGAHTRSSLVGYVVDYSGGSALVYPWEMSHEIPPGYWGSEPGPGACTTPVTYVQVMEWAHQYPFYTFDPPGLFTPDPYTCIANGINGGKTLFEVVPDCASVDSPTIRLEAEPVCP